MKDSLTNLKHFKVTQSSDSIIHVVFDRPPVNAFTGECYSELSHIIQHVNETPAISVMMLTSAQRHFSAGADWAELKQDAEAGADAVAIRRTKLRKVWAQFKSCEAVVVAGINGGTVGIGAALVAVADIVIAERAAFIAIPEIDIGLIGASQALSRIIPAGRLRAISLTAERVSAEELHRLGSIYRVVDTENLETETQAIADSVAKHGSKVVRKWKESFILSANATIDQGGLIESVLNAELH